MTKTNATLALLGLFLGALALLAAPDHFTGLHLGAVALITTAVLRTEYAARGGVAR